MIRQVKAHQVGQQYIYNGVLCRIVRFPTRYSVVLENIQPKPGIWSRCKTSVREFNKIASRISGVPLGTNLKQLLEVIAQKGSK